jgi:hypothetical protein
MNFQQLHIRQDDIHYFAQCELRDGNLEIAIRNAALRS